MKQDLIKGKDMISKISMIPAIISSLPVFTAYPEVIGRGSYSHYYKIVVKS
jgi:hypothetical protein